MPLPARYEQQALFVHLLSIQDPLAFFIIIVYFDLPHIVFAYL